MKRILGMTYGYIGYLAFVLPIAYLAGFLADVGVPKTVDRGAGPFGPALWVDVALIVAFGVQHSVMARTGFKSWIRGWIPEGLERSTYMLVSAVMLAVVFWLWRPIPAVLWDVSGGALEAAAWLAYAAGWGVAIWATFAISHFHFSGVAQANAFSTGSEHPRTVLRATVLYRIVRHPMTAGLLLALWSTPRMTLGHLLFASVMSGYCLIGTVLEEGELLRAFPERYKRYRRQVPALIPVLRWSRWIPEKASLAAELGALALGIAAMSLPLLLAAPSAASGPAESESLERGELQSGGFGRSYALIDLASEYPDPRPVVLALHGTGGSAKRIRGFLGGALEWAAGERGWVVAYPEAHLGAWNDCRRELRAAARRKGVDDVAFLAEVIHRLRSESNIDPDRVFLLGYSGGGHMALRVALEAPRLVRGIAFFGASLPVDEELACRVHRDAPAVMVVNGTSDLVNPYDGGDVVTPTGVLLGECVLPKRRLHSSRSAATETCGSSRFGVGGTPCRERRPGFLGSWDRPSGPSRASRRRCPSSRSSEGDIGISLTSQTRRRQGVEMSFLDRAKLPTLLLGSIPMALGACTVVGGGVRPTPGAPPVEVGPAPPRGPAPSVEEGEPRAADRVTARVVEVALQSIGTPYEWGGTDENGFDCSGLIQFAYGKLGIRLPRMSAAQMRAGSPVAPERTVLRPGDLLGFAADRSGLTSHVGLYIGGDEFIHSSTTGVRVSTLRNDYWRERLVAVRRIVE